jgi:hypothetical protein
LIGNKEIEKRVREFEERPVGLFTKLFGKKAKLTEGGWEESGEVREAGVYGYCIDGEWFFVKGGE